MANLLEQALDKAGLVKYTAKVKTALAAKQDKLEGIEGQVVGFDAAGNAVACTTNGMIGYMFRVSEEGDLLLHYVEENAPNFYVGQDGNLYLNFKEEGN